MIGRVCKVFPGHTYESCRNMTRGQLKTAFGESWRQEARETIRLIGALVVSKYPKKEYDQAMMGLKYQAYPPDPEEDGDLNDDQILKVMKAFGAQEEAINKQRGRGK